jgi:uncharacterized membrane protein
MGADIVGVVISTILIYLLPGFVWTYVIFDKKQLLVGDEPSVVIKALERIALSIGLSLVLVPLTTFVLNIFVTLSPSVLNTLLISLLPTVIGVILYFLRSRGYLNLERLSVRKHRNE